MTPADRLKSGYGRIIVGYKELLEFSASPLTTTCERWEQCQNQAEAILDECADRVAGIPVSKSAALQRTAELGAKRAAEHIAGIESIRAALLLWQSAVPVMRETLSDATADHSSEPSPLTVALDALAQALMGRLLHGAVGYTDPGIIQKIQADQERGAAQNVPAAGNTTAWSTPLTVREQEVLSFAAEAMSNREIGRKLGIAENTVKRHFRNIFAKLGAVSRLDALQKAGMSVQARR